ncbi:MAG: AMP-binding protein [Butyrivibrio sp.]|uniref:AMP-binding protein n=1 Tax=Butyrivibrio sp. TaxID=28121 RepID=UPI0025B9EFF6|nr:AMP-binding protein [Butyrivibrio sp.]MBQ6588243.1 AMP-binding protein [Butyrivibrio sp.]
MESIRQLFDYMVNEYSDTPALKWPVNNDVSEISYTGLGQNVSRLRKGLRADGLSKDHIAIVGFSSESWIEAFFAITTGDNTAVLIDPLLSDEEIIDLLVRSDSSAVFLDTSKKALSEKLQTSCPLVRNTYYLDSLHSLKDSSSYSSDVFGLSGDNTAMIIFTSGTTGKSKGVMLTQKNLVSNVEAVEYESVPGRVVLSVLPIHHAFCLVMDYLKCLSLGSTVCINDSFLHMVKNMQLFKPEVMLMVPMMLETIYKKLQGAAKLLPKKVVANKVFGGRLTTVFSGGAHLDPFYIEKFAEYGVNVYEGYGMSECSPVISTNTPTAHKPGSVGKVLKNAEVRFKNGEILVKSSSLMTGYYKMPKETNEALSDGWLHTGDKGYMDEEGYLFINGRVKNLIILSNGENVSPEEIENKLCLYPLIEEVVVTGDGNGLTARIYPDQELIAKKKLDSEKIKEKLRKILDEYNSGVPSYRRIAHLVIRENPFRRNTTRKILRQYAAEDVPA